MRSIIALAYAVPTQEMSYRLLGGSERLLDAHFDIEARTAVETTRTDALAMLRTLLVGKAAGRR